MEETHEAIIDQVTFDFVQQEMAQRKALGARANKSLNLSCFSGKIKCPHCNINYVHEPQRRKSNIEYWLCGSKKKKKVGDGCPVKGAMSEIALKKCCAEALGLDEFDEEVFAEKVEHLEVPEKDRLTFFMQDGSVFTRDCKNTGHQDCWTEEQRAAVSVYRRNHASKRSGSTCFTGKIKCSSCGMNYRGALQTNGNTTTRYWRCPSKGEACKKGLRDDRLRELCADVLGMTSFDEAAFEKEIDYTTVLPAINENAHVALDQTAYQKRFDELNGKFEEAKHQHDDAKKQIADRTSARTATRQFIGTLKKMDGLITEFDPSLWGSLLDHLMVYSKEDVRFTFKDGTEIKP